VTLGGGITMQYAGPGAPGSGVKRPLAIHSS